VSIARECDLCGGLFKPAVGAVTLEVYVDCDDDGESNSWSDVELCVPCSKRLLALISPALEGFANITEEKGGSAK
jgi:hypothetical protein